jgi:hypothetical protein
MPNDRFVWSVQVRDYQTKAPLARVSVTAIEQTWDCKTRVMPRPVPAQDHDHRPPSIETYDCKGGRNHITRLTDAGGSVTFQLPHPQYEIAPIKRPDYLPTDFPDPSFRRIASSLTKTSTTAGRRLSEYWLFPYAALKVKTGTQAEALALQNTFVKNCLGQHPQLTHDVERPSLTWRVQFRYPGANSLKLVTTVDSLSEEVGFLGCWDPCCSGRAPSRFERRLTECAKLRNASSQERKPWDCDTLPQDFDRLKDFYRRQGDSTSLQKFEELYRAYEAAGN